VVLLLSLSVVLFFYVHAIADFVVAVICDVNNVFLVQLFDILLDAVPRGDNLQLQSRTLRLSHHLNFQLYGKQHLLAGPEHKNSKCQLSL
jgi:hypothetical protein